MAHNNRCDFSKGVGFSYDAVFHLLQGTKKSKIQRESSHEDAYFLDENLRGYSWGDSQELAEINEMQLKTGSLSQEIKDLRKRLQQSKMRRNTVNVYAKELRDLLTRAGIRSHSFPCGRRSLGSISGMWFTDQLMDLPQGKE